MRLASFGLLASLLLSLGGLPAAHQLQAFRVLAVPLVPRTGLIDGATPSAQADPPAEAATAGRNGLTETMLEMSQGRACSRRGRPRDRLNLSGTFYWSSSSLDDTIAALNLAGQRRRTYPGRAGPQGQHSFRRHRVRRQQFIRGTTGGGREEDKEGDRVDLDLPPEGEEGSRRGRKPSARCSPTRC